MSTVYKCDMCKKDGAKQQLIVYVSKPWIGKERSLNYKNIDLCEKCVQKVKDFFTVSKKDLLSNLPAPKKCNTPK